MASSTGVTSLSVLVETRMEGREFVDQLNDYQLMK
jgi:hypothetical protein